MTPVLLVRNPRPERPPGLPGPRGTAGIACWSRAQVQGFCSLLHRCLAPSPQTCLSVFMPRLLCWGPAGRRVTLCADGIIHMSPVILPHKTTAQV